MAKKPQKQFDYDLKSVWFSNDEVVRYSSWIDEATADLESVVYALTDRQLKVSCTVDQNQSCFLVSVTAKPNGKGDKGMVFMFRHTDLTKAYRMALFYLSEVIDWNYQQTDDDSDLSW